MRAVGGKSWPFRRSTLQRKLPAWQGKMHAILERGWLTGQQKAAGLCRHIWKYFDALWTFIKVEGVEPTNNTAERGFRGGVIKRKLSFGVQSESGRKFLERTMSVIATCRQRGIDEGLPDRLPPSPLRRQSRPQSARIGVNGYHAINNPGNRIEI